MNTSSIKQSFAWWCFAPHVTDPLELLRAAASIGYAGVDLIDEHLWPVAKDCGLEVVAVPGHNSIEEGLNRAENADRIEAEILVQIEKAAQWNIKQLICFSGNRNGQDDEASLEIASQTLSRVTKAAEQAGVTLCLELLNSKVDHPDYQADSTAWGVELCRRVDSPAVRLLYDIYHMQVMEGDLIRSIEANHESISHYHTAGNPGRGPIDARQEINYPAVFRSIAATGFTGYIGHEFLTEGDPVVALREAFALCNQI